jgi:hypothetical protein
MTKKTKATVGTSSDHNVVFDPDQFEQFIKNLETTTLDTAVHDAPQLSESKPLEETVVSKEMPMIKDDHGNVVHPMATEYDDRMTSPISESAVKPDSMSEVPVEPHQTTEPEEVSTLLDDSSHHPDDAQFVDVPKTPEVACAVEPEAPWASPDDVSNWLLVQKKVIKSWEQALHYCQKHQRWIIIGVSSCVVILAAISMMRYVRMAPKKNKTVDLIAEAPIVQSLSDSMKEQQQDIVRLKQSIDTIEQSVRTMMVDHTNRDTSAINDMLTKINNRIDILAQTVNTLQEQLHTLSERPLISVGQTETNSAIVAHNNQQWFVQAAIPGRAWLRDRSGQLMTVTMGDPITGMGIVSQINPQQGTVQTTNGTLFTTEHVSSVA